MGEEAQQTFALTPPFSTSLISRQKCFGPTNKPNTIGGRSVGHSNPINRMMACWPHERTTIKCGLKLEE
jgi:hypothetical protein